MTDDDEDAGGLCWAPEIRIVGRLALDRENLRDFLGRFGPDADRFLEGAASDGEFAAEVAGRLCYLSFPRPRPGGPAAYHEHILASGHGSVYHHSVYEFVISGVSRSLTHELVRHKAGVDPSELSQRYVDASMARVVVPPLLAPAVDACLLRDRVCGGREPAAAEAELARLIPPSGPWADGSGGVSLVRFHDCADLGACWLEAVAAAREAYARIEDAASRYLLGAGGRQGAGPGTAERKAAREAARSVLPGATESAVYITANARALRNVFEQRCSPHADAEMRRLCLAWLRLMRAEAPHLFADFEFATAPALGDSGTPIEYAICKYHKV